MNFFLFQIFPYIAIAIFALGSILRFDRDPYTWRSKSSQFLRRKQLIVGSILFHGGVITILLGHAVGLLTPTVVFKFLGISYGAKQIMAMGLGGVAGIFMLIGLLMLLHRRLYDERIRATSSFSDIGVLVLLLIQLLLGLASIFVSMGHLDGIEMIKFMNWAQHIVTFRGGADVFLTDVSIIFKMHITFGFLIMVVWPFTRLVHVFSAPLGFVFRPYQIVRKREK